MKKIVGCAIMAILLCAGCKDKIADPTDAPKAALQSALELLKAHDYDAYINTVDLSCEMDSLHAEIMTKLLRQHIEMTEGSKGRIDSYRVFDAKKSCDSVCTVYYQTIFADSTKEVSSQKMVLTDGVWKIRVRN